MYPPSVDDAESADVDAELVHIRAIRDDRPRFAQPRAQCRRERTREDQTVRLRIDARDENGLFAVPIHRPPVATHPAERFHLEYRGVSAQGKVSVERYGSSELDALRTSQAEP